MKKVLKKIAKHFKNQLEFVFNFESRFISKWNSAAHKRLMFAQWALDPQPEFFDHHIDLNYQWTNTRNPLWVERGVFGALALKGNSVLELACGDGFNAKNFYSIKAEFN